MDIYSAGRIYIGVLPNTNYKEYKNFEVIGDHDFMGMMDVSGKYEFVNNDVVKKKSEPQIPQSQEVETKEVLKSAREFWKDKWEEEPQNDAEKLACAMMAEYGRYIKENSAPPVQLKEPFNELLEFMNGMTVKQTLFNGCDIDTVHIPSLIHKINEIKSQLKEGVKGAEGLRQKITEILHEGLDTVSTIDSLVELLSPSTERVFTREDVEAFAEWIVVNGYQRTARRDHVSFFKDDKSFTPKELLTEFLTSIK